MEKVKSMLSNFELKKHFWAEVVRIACYLINQYPTIAVALMNKFALVKW